MDGNKLAISAEDIFSSIDKDGDGYITMQEMVQAITYRRDIVQNLQAIPQLELLLRPGTWKATFKSIDIEIDDDSQISREEFIQFTTRAVGLTKMDNIASRKEASPDDIKAFVREVFKFIDKDADGFITMKEMSRAIAYQSDLVKRLESFPVLENLLRPSKWKETFKIIDVEIDDDGKISLEEFIKFADRGKLGTQGGRHDQVVTANFQKQVIRIFSMIDKDGDGYITIKEMTRAVAYQQKLIQDIKSIPQLSGLLRPSTWKQTFREIDLEIVEDGQLSKAEFLLFSTRMAGQDDTDESRLSKSILLLQRAERGRRMFPRQQEQECMSLSDVSRQFTAT